MSISFIHIADLHLERPFPFLSSDKADRLREKQYESFKRLIKVANNKKVDFILVAGDVFNSNEIQAKNIKRFLNYCRQSDNEIVIIPGNHDPNTSTYPLTGSSIPKNVTVLSNDPHEVKGYKIVPGVPKKDNTVPVPQIKDKKAIYLAHGSIDQDGNVDFDYPINLEEVKEANYKYSALGHWHTKKIYDSFKAAYPGTLMPISFDDGHGYCKVDINENGKVIINHNEISTIAWHQFKITVYNNIDPIENKIKQYKNNDTLLKINIDGTLSPTQLESIKQIVKEVKKEYFYLEINYEVKLESSRDRSLPSSAQRIDDKIKDSDYIPDKWPFENAPTEQERRIARSILNSNISDDGNGN